MNKYVSPYSISQSSGILTEKWGVCWYKKLYDWWVMDGDWYYLLYTAHYPRSEQLSPEEFKEIVKYKSNEEFEVVVNSVYSYEERCGNTRITIKDVMKRLIRKAQ